MQIACLIDLLNKAKTETITVRNSNDQFAMKSMGAIQNDFSRGYSRTPRQTTYALHLQFSSPLFIRS